MIGDQMQAMELYEDAIMTSGSQAFLHEEALSCELTAEFYLRRSRHRLAEDYLKQGMFEMRQLKS